MPLERIFQLLYKSIEIHVAMSLVLLITFINLIWPTLFGIPWAYWLTLYYGVIFPLIFIFRTLKHISERKIEDDFGRYFRVEE